MKYPHALLQYSFRTLLRLIGLIAIAPAHASPHTRAHEAPTTKEWTFQETIQTRLNHRVVDNDDRRMPSDVLILCTDRRAGSAYWLRLWPGFAKVTTE